MAKLMITAFVAVVSMVFLYVMTFLSYMILYTEELVFEQSLLDSIPLRAQMLVLKSYGPTLFLFVLPLSTVIFFTIWVSASLKRWSHLKNVIKSAEIRSPKICVALTAYDDEASIYDAVRDFGAQEHVVEVIVVDNNSKDSTAVKAAEAGARVVKETRQGYGYACIRGLREALENKETDVVVLAEGDRTFRGNDIKKLVPYLENADMVLGTRTTQELLDPKSQLDWFYIWGNLFLAKLIQIKYWDIRHWGRVRLTDVGCTMRTLRREALEKVVDHLYVGGNHFSPHMIIVALQKGIKVVEVPVTFRPRVGESKGAGGSKWRATKIGLQMMWHILSF